MIQMMKITSKDVEKYMAWRTDEKFKHCPIAVSKACNYMIDKFYSKFNNDNITAKDFMKLLFFNDPIPSLFTHNYGFHTATGRNIIETLKMKYYEYKD